MYLMLGNTKDNQAENENIIANSRLNIVNNSNRKKGKWTNEEDELLKKCISLYGEKQWRTISEHVAGRSSTQCLHRWTKFLKPGLVKGTWTQEEDQKLITWVQTEGPIKWAQAAAYIKGRNGKQCRERWFNNLNPGVKKGNWTTEEDSLIFELYKKYGSSWSTIAKLMSGRSENAIKNRFYSSLKRLKEENNKQFPNISYNVNTIPVSENIEKIGKLEQVEIFENKLENLNKNNIEILAWNNLYSTSEQQIIDEEFLNYRNNTNNDNEIKKRSKVNNDIDENINAYNNTIKIGIDQNHPSNNVLTSSYSKDINVCKILSNNVIGCTLSTPNKLNHNHNYGDNHDDKNILLFQMTKPEFKEPPEFNENEDSDNNFERFLMNIEKNINDNMLSKDMMNYLHLHPHLPSNLHSHIQRNHNGQSELDKIYKSVISYCNYNIIDLADSFKSILSTQLEDSQIHRNEDHFVELSPLNESRCGYQQNLKKSIDNPFVNNPNLLEVQTINHADSIFDGFNYIKISGNSISHQSNDLTKGINIFKNGLDMAKMQNILRNEAIVNLQNSNLKDENKNMIFDMISKITNDKGNYNEQKLLFLFKQLYSLENLLTNTKNQLVKLETSINNQLQQKEDTQRENFFFYNLENQRIRIRNLEQEGVQEEDHHNNQTTFHKVSSSQLKMIKEEHMHMQVQTMKYEYP